MALPDAIDFARDPAASPARMNVAMGHVDGRLRALEVVRASVDAVLTQLQEIGLERINDALQPYYQQLKANIDLYNALVAAQTILGGTYGQPATRITIRRSSTPGEVPASLLPGELGLNDADGLLHWLDQAGTLRSTKLLDLVTHADVTATLASYVTSLGLSAALQPYATAASVATSVTAAVAALVASSPTTLNTLKELADALGDDPNYATTTAAALALRLRVDAAQSFTVAQKAQGRSNIGAAESGANISITSLGGLTARPSWSGGTLYDTANLTADQVSAILGYTPGRQSTPFNTQGGGAGINGQNTPTAIASVDFAATGAGILVVGALMITDLTGNPTEAYAYIALNDLSTGQIVAQSVAQGCYLTTSATAGGNMAPVLAVGGLVIGHTYRALMLAYTTGSINTRATSIQLSGVNL